MDSSLGFSVDRDGSLKGDRVTSGSFQRFGWAIGIAGVVLSLAVGATLAILFRGDPVPPIVATGPDLQARVDSAVVQVEDRYPHVLLEVRSLSHGGILIRSRWEKPEAGMGDFADEVGRRAADQREATVAFLQAIARSDPSIKRLGAAEDGLLVPAWSRAQILGAGDPRTFRDFATYSAFQFSAEDLGGYAVISGSLKDR
ncbi:MAG: hypothetical protein ACR2KQ_03845 [Actinomycetota bacterium]